MMLKEIDIFSCLMRIKTYFKNLIFLNQGGRERVRNPFSPSLNPPSLSANCLTLFCWFVDSFLCQGFNLVKLIAKC